MCIIGVIVVFHILENSLLQSDALLIFQYFSICGTFSSIAVFGREIVMYSRQRFRTPNLESVGESLELFILEKTWHGGPATKRSTRGTVLKSRDIMSPYKFSGGQLACINVLACLFVSAENTCRCGMFACRRAKIGASVPEQNVPTDIVSFGSG